MSIGMAMAFRSARLQVLLDAIDAGSAAGRLLIYKGTRPATGGAATGGDLLADFALSDPAGVVTDEVLAFSAIASVTASATGLPSWARFTDSDATAVLDGDVGITGAGTLVEMEEDSGDPGNVVSLIEDGLAIISSAQLTEGNP